MPPVFRRRVVVQFLAPPQDFLSFKLKVYPTRRISRLFNLVPAPARAICKIMASGRKKSSVGFGRTNGARISIGFHNLRAFAPYGHGHVFDARSTVSLGCHGYFSSSLLVQTRIKVAATANIPQGDLEALARCRSEMTCGCNDISAALLSGPGIRERLVDALNPPHKEGLSFLRQLTALLSLSLAATHKDSKWPRTTARRRPARGRPRPRLRRPRRRRGSVNRRQQRRPSSPTSVSPRDRVETLGRVTYRKVNGSRRTRVRPFAARTEPLARLGDCRPHQQQEGKHVRLHSCCWAHLHTLLAIRVG
jgi:hypothetical protein